MVLVEHAPFTRPFSCPFHINGYLMHNFSNSCYTEVFVCFVHTFGVLLYFLVCFLCSAFSKSVHNFNISILFKFKLFAVHFFMTSIISKKSLECINNSKTHSFSVGSRETKDAWDSNESLKKGSVRRQEIKRETLE